MTKPLVLIRLLNACSSSGGKFGVSSMYFKVASFLPSSAMRFNSCFGT